MVLVRLADGRTVARTADELQDLTPEDQAAAAAALGLAPPAPGRA